MNRFEIRSLWWSFAVCMVLYASPGAAQIVIEERVEIRPDSTAGTDESGEGERWPGGVRGRGTLTFTFGGARTFVHPLDVLTLTLKTTKGGATYRQVSFSASAGGSIYSQATGTCNSANYDFISEDYNFTCQRY